MIKMKNLILIFSVFFISSCKKENDKSTINSAVSQDSVSVKTDRDSSSLDQGLNTIDNIKSAYQLTNSQLLAKKLDSVSFEYDCDESSGTVVFYSDQNDLKAIKHSYAEHSHFSSVDQYFINDNQPYFIFQTETVWSFDGGTTEKPETKDDVTEKRFYIINEKATQCLEKKYILKSNSSNNPKSENIPNKELKNCSITDLQKTFDLLMKHKNRRGNGKCL